MSQGRNETELERVDRNFQERFRDDVKEELLLSASRLAIVGMSLLALGICGAVFLVVHFVAGDVAGAVAVAGLLTAYLAIWVAWPIAGIRS